MKFSFILFFLHYSISRNSLKESMGVLEV